MFLMRDLRIVNHDGEHAPAINCGRPTWPEDRIEAGGERILIGESVIGLERSESRSPDSRNETTAKLGFAAVLIRDF
jgi:hypothetical protein